MFEVCLIDRDLEELEALEADSLGIPAPPRPHSARQLFSGVSNVSQVALTSSETCHARRHAIGYHALGGARIC